MRQAIRLASWTQVFTHATGPSGCTCPPRLARAASSANQVVPSQAGFWLRRPLCCLTPTTFLSSSIYTWLALPILSTNHSPIDLFASLPPVEFCSVFPSLSFFLLYHSCLDVLCESYVKSAYSSSATQTRHVLQHCLKAQLTVAMQVALTLVHTAKRKFSCSL